jgi:hypothetical protein
VLVHIFVLSNLIKKIIWWWLSLDLLGLFFSYWSEVGDIVLIFYILSISLLLRWRQDILCCLNFLSQITFIGENTWNLY